MRRARIACAAFALCASCAAVASAEPAPPAASEDPGSLDLLADTLPIHAQGVVGNPVLVTDGQIAPEGAIWNAPPAVTLAPRTSITYDLGQLRTIRALYVQADANDSYEVLAAQDDSDASYRRIGEFPVVVERGHGLRMRFLEIAPVQARYLRIGESGGDGFFSIAEFAAYAHPPSPFPPAFRVVPAPSAQAVPGIARDPRAQQARVRALGLFAAAAALALFGLPMLFVRLFSRLRNREGEAAARNPALAAQKRRDAELRVMFVLSGCAALIYEVVWFHLLRLVIGASSLSVGIVLASFMGGMFLGSLLFERLVDENRHPLRSYALLELGIGGFGLLMPLCLPAVRSIYVGLVGYGALGIALRALVAAALLLPPTALMGATLPAVARLYTHGRRGTSALAALYANNTLGAVLGCLLSGFYLLARYDVWVTTATAAALNFAIFAWAMSSSRGTPASIGSKHAAASAPASAPRRVALLAYVGTGLSGMAALGAQVVWTRLLTLLFGATVYAFAIILAVFLAGLGIGGALASYLLRRGQPAFRALFLSQLGLLPVLLISSMLLADVIPFASPPAMTPIDSLHALHVLRAIEVMLPAAVLFGMSFPFALAAAASAHASAPRASARVYAANTLGAIVGALAVSFFAIPSFGTQWATQALVVVAAIGAALLSAGLSPGGPTPEKPRRRWPARGVWILAAGCTAAALLPGMPTAFLAHGRHIWWIDARDQYPYVSEGASSTVAVHIAADGYRNFHVSGRVEASNGPSDMRLERLLGHLSALATPHPTSVLVVGLGGGVTAGALALHKEVERMVICEIEPRVVGAAEQFAAENYSVLKDPRVRLVFDDARHFLATSSERFDVITSDPIHPWVRGNSVLFSREYYAIVKARLKPGGIATQWVPLYDTSEEAIRIQMRTFADAFPEGSVWNSSIAGRGYDVVLLGSMAPLHLDLAAIAQRIAADPRVAESLRAVQINSVVDLLATYGAGIHDMRAWVAGIPVNRDFSLKLEYISGLALNEQNADAIYAHMVARRTFPERLFFGPAEQRDELRRRILAGNPAGLR